MNTTPGSEDHVKALKNKILKLATDLNMSKYIDVANGAYSSTLHTLDIATKTYEKTTYEYGKDLMLNKNGVLPTGLKLNDRAIQEHREVPKARKVRRITSSQSCVCTICAITVQNSGSAMPI